MPYQHNGTTGSAMLRTANCCAQNRGDRAGLCGRSTGGKIKSASPRQMSYGSVVLVITSRGRELLPPVSPYPSSK